MNTFYSILVAGLTVGALYAIATIGLSLIWGALGVLNMAHGALLTLGGYMAYYAISVQGLPVWAGIAASLLAGAAAGGLLYIMVVRNVLRQDNVDFETNVMIATVGVAIAVENGILLLFGGRPLKQPVSIDGSGSWGALVVPWQNLAIVVAAILAMVAVALLLARTRMGRAIRATSQSRDAARLMGVAVDRVYLVVLMLSGLIAAGCGLLLSTMTQLSPSLGGDPMLKAFIMCVVAGLGNVPGAVLVSFGLALLEAWTEYALGARWGFPILLSVVVCVLIWRPTGLLGSAQIRRL
ncbi:branched-chain amino acid ABC transporter permease [Bradyrhizobium sp. CCBAU 21360]|uniref:branched-chain amino acid ABC transporter permease n=1 Tax=Bradyrhizobium sp. CCBAU 21360 TaxID=1325081 RepID=UPI0023059908|nr:branched-chain amino acid ABC transporter permease [Bradyrhizobium sp. CCBAU 21360]MDA9448320.1 branched-chain amino acid ABC transporter permease [Bradyrhizobium sp. CCBAU 21360]